MPTQDPFALALQHARVDAAMQQSDLAQALSRDQGKKISQSTVSRWESGKRIPSDSQFASIVAVFEELAPEQAGRLLRTRHPDLPAVMLHKLLFGEAPARSRRKPVVAMVPGHWLDGATPTYMSPNPEGDIEEEPIGTLRSDTGIRSKSRVQVVVSDDLVLSRSLEQVLAPHLATSVRVWSVGEDLPVDEKRILTIGWLSNPWYRSRSDAKGIDADAELKEWGLRKAHTKGADLVLFERSRVQRPAEIDGPAPVVALVGGIGARHTRRAGQLFSPPNVADVVNQINPHIGHDGEVSVVLEIPRDGDRLHVSELVVHPRTSPRLRT